MAPAAAASAWICAQLAPAFQSAASFCAFAGSGTELVERAFAGPYARLIGSDLEERALSAARENLAAAGLRGVLLSRADATTYAPEGVTLVLTNPPMGRRVSRSAELAATLDAFVDHAARVLVPGGRMVWLSPVPARSRERARPGPRGRPEPATTAPARPWTNR